MDAHYLVDQWNIPYGVKIHIVLNSAAVCTHWSFSQVSYHFQAHLIFKEVFNPLETTQRYKEHIGKVLLYNQMSL